MDVVKELLGSQQTLEDLIGDDYQVTSLSVPAGEYPQNEALLASGSYDGKAYTYTSAVTLGDTMCASPFSTLFNVMHIPRITVTGNTLRDADSEPQGGSRDRGTSRTAIRPPSRRRRDLADGLGSVRDDLGRPLIRY